MFPNSMLLFICLLFWTIVDAVNFSEYTRTWLSLGRKLAQRNRRQTSLHATLNRFNLNTNLTLIYFQFLYFRKSTQFLPRSFLAVYFSETFLIWETFWSSYINNSSLLTPSPLPHPLNSEMANHWIFTILGKDVCPTHIVIKLYQVVD